jgi:ABC-type transport system involved in cytochrome c biogenesis ATPase subunit
MSSSPLMQPANAMQFVRLLYGAPFFIMVALIFVEAGLTATVTYFIIQAGKDIASNDFRVMDFVWILAAQSGSYILHGISWIFGERAGFTAYARYIAQFAHTNRHQPELLGARELREETEPFLTNEAFHLIFELMYELEGALQLFFGLILSALVIGMEIDEGFPIAYALIFLGVMTMQYLVRKPVERVYLANQRMTNRLTAQTYTAWDNITAGNRYNLHLWLGKFKQRLREALRAQINAILLRETLSTISGILSLLVIFGVMVWVVSKDSGNIVLMAGLLATLPKQIEMTRDVHQLAIGWNDLLALWTRAKGVVAHRQPRLRDGDGQPIDVASRIKFPKLKLREGDTQIDTSSLAHILAAIHAQPTGRINVRGANGAGKSTLLVSLRQHFGGRAFYWPTADRLAFAYVDQPEEALHDSQLHDEDAQEPQTPKRGYSSGEQQITALREIVERTRAHVYLLDEWDANLDGKNRVRAKALIDQLAARARVVEISHRDLPADAAKPS